MRGIGIVAIAAMVALSGCSTADDTKAARDAVGTFRQQFAAAQYPAIYQAAAADLKSTVTEAQFAEQVGKFHDGLGALKTATETGWSADANGLVTLNFDSEYANAKTKEDFVYRIADGKALLAGYNIKTVDGASPAAPAANEAVPAADSEDAAAEGEAEGT
ncbi:MAG: hypothetical protein V4808_06660 [Pseudomonadota bacterium]